ncbi:MAG TPA: NfeD family protein, partial [Anaerolineales bacterium]|nr:NfeD family protein [Anaerolineales bacterium]
MEFLLVPSIAYLVLVAAVLLTLVAIMTPGTGLAELLALFALLLAGYAVYHLSFNWWALLLLVLSAVPFIYSIRGRQRGIWLAVSILGLTAGSVFFFPATQGWLAVNPWLAAITTVLYSAFLWVAARKVVEASTVQPVHELSSIIGQRGEARTAIGADGAVQVAGELWSARSQTSVPAGAAVEVVGRDGFVLVVQPV